MSGPVYRRVLLKLSGEALMGEQAFGIDPAVTTQIAREIGEIQQLGVQTGVVIGGGNLFRGLANRPGIGLWAALLLGPVLFLWGLALHWRRWRDRKRGA